MFRRQLISKQDPIVDDEPNMNEDEVDTSLFASIQPVRSFFAVLA
jgi:hypothetical protein